MTKPVISAESLLAIDVGAVTTRAMLFDVVDGRYRFLAAGSAPTTAGAPFSDIGEGIRRALTHLTAITGREFIDSDEHLILPSVSDARGVDACVATISAGPPLNVVAVGLLEDVSVESAQRLAKTIYARISESLGLNDRRKPAARLDALIRARPDLIIVAGGTDGGASQSVLSQLESVGLACYLIPEQQRPEVLYAGNADLVDEVDVAVGSLTRLTIAPNIRPSLEFEQLGPAQTQLGQIYRRLRARKMGGVQNLETWTGERLLPTSSAFARILRFLSRVYDPGKGVLGVDIGASATTLAGAFGGELALGVYPELGLGANVVDMLQQGHADLILRWLYTDVTEHDLRNYLHNKALYPASIPATVETLSIEQALARQAMQWAVSKLNSRFPAELGRVQENLLPFFEPIFATGSVITRAPTRGQSLLMVLDGLQPVGVTTVVVDQNNLLAALGAAAAANPVIPVQLLDSSTFLNLGTVIAPVGDAPLGAAALKVRIKHASGEEKTLEVKHGALEVIPVPLGQPVELHLQPLNRFDVGMGGPGKGGGVRVTGGALGVVIDARGRPLRLPADPAQRKELLKRWITVLGG